MSKINVSFFLTTLFLTLIFSFSCNKNNSQPESQPIQPELAKTILAEVKNRYATFSSYQDSGVLKITTVSWLILKSEENIQFKTYYSRPEKLRFEWIDNSTGKPIENVLLVTKNKSSIYREQKILEQRPDSALTLNAFFMSRGAIHSVPRLLTEAEKFIGGFPLTDLVNLSLEKEEMFDEDLCYVIKGSHQVPPESYELAKIELWVSKNNYAIRKIRTVTRDKSKTDEQIYNNIKFNQIVPDYLFVFSQ